MSAPKEALAPCFRGGSGARLGRREGTPSTFSLLRGGRWVKCGRQWVTLPGRMWPVLSAMSPSPDRELNIWWGLKWRQAQPPPTPGHGPGALADTVKSPTTPMECVYLGCAGMRVILHYCPISQVRGPTCSRSHGPGIIRCRRSLRL